MEYKTGKLLEEIRSDLSDLIGRYSYQTNDKDPLDDKKEVRRVLENILHEIDKEFES